MGVYTRLVSSILFPLHERLKSHDTVAVRRALECSQWFEVSEIRKHQLRRLRHFLIEIGSSVTYYHEMFERLDFDPSRLDCLSALEQLPLLTKKQIRNSFEALTDPNARGLRRSSTGGSSGEPLIFALDNERVTHDVAAKWRATRWWGVDIGDPEVMVWGSPIELSSQDRVRALRDWVFRTRLLPAFEMSPEALDRFITVIRSKRPRMLFGYPSALNLLASHADRTGTTMCDLGIRVAFVTGERLYADQRAAISRVFGCAVANGYGARDAGFVAHECPWGNMHISAENIVVEVVDGDGHAVPPGTPGEIVVTHLSTRAFPFVRYRTGDIGVLDDRTCACGRGLPLLREVQGRRDDFVVALDGTVMHGLALTYLLRDRPGIEAFKIIQESRWRTRVLLVVTDEFDPTLRLDVIRQFKYRLGSTVEIEVEFVNRIAAEPSGKHRYVISRIAPVTTAIE